MLAHDPVLSDLARHEQAESESSAFFDWLSARRSELEAEYCGMADFWDAVGYEDNGKRVNALWRHLQLGEFASAKGCASAIMLNAAKNYAASTIAKELEGTALAETARLN